MRRPAHPAPGCRADGSGAPAGSRRGSSAALLALLTVALGTTAAVAFGFDAGLALAALRTHHAWLLGFVSRGAGRGLAAVHGGLRCCGRGLGARASRS